MTESGEMGGEEQMGRTIVWDQLGTCMHVILFRVGVEEIGDKVYR